jgi:hypothetical protein
MRGENTKLSVRFTSMILLLHVSLSGYSLLEGYFLIKISEKPLMPAETVQRVIWTTFELVVRCFLINRAAIMHSLIINIFI